MSKRRHNFGTKRFKEKSLFIFHARIALKSLILLFVRQIARGARIGKIHTQTDRQTDRHTDRTSTVTLAHARRGLNITEISDCYYTLYINITEISDCYYTLYINITEISDCYYTLYINITEISDCYYHYI